VETKTCDAGGILEGWWECCDR